ncbi:nucleotide exchange factor GrpE [Phaeovibrio sulfidiphilus]|uniref:Protein GrpE n=1 Tax=Phaeovibrio sulfidiphilus TaxID=1220600 RepID=A0A8J6YMP1_9PROT|nr:nucleotide exchange factor GrpE [Phaeovibrio sulfidiphilus]MBE1236131.1 nucleotide exchange factor GrpE [Phaeovibrio sulfidiphilus]
MHKSQDPSNTTSHPNREPLDALADDATEAAAPASDGGEDSALQARVAALEAENRKLKEDYLRALAEAENARRMADRRIEDNNKFAVSNFAKALLGVADNLGRALLAAPGQARETNEPLNNLAIGIEMTERELQRTLGDYKVRRIQSLNAPFDPNLHQAVQEVEDTSVPTGTVVQVYQDGYQIHDRLLRPAMVVVSRGGPKRDVPQDGASGGDSGPFGGAA